jgi:nicotinate-nucleotide adenylyltransferase
VAGLTGIFGGTFDPPHLGHLILADEARIALGLDKVLWVVAGAPPHKLDRVTSPPEARWEMVGAAIEDTPEFGRSSVDLDRPGPHYSLDTLRALRELGVQRAAFIMGSDSLIELPAWHQPQAFVELCEVIGVMRRPGPEADLDALEAALPGLKQRVRFFEAPFIGISGHDVRQRVFEGRAFQYLVTPRVADVIRRRGLYRPDGA